MHKVSVIIPVYNSSQFLPKCLDCVLGQTYKEIEIICINDGSVDTSLSILNEYASLHENLIIIDQSNQGVSVARNTGIERASGNYVTFLDSDDYVELGYIENLVSCILNHDVDLVCSGLADFCDEGIISTIRLSPAVIELTYPKDIIGFLNTLLNTSPVCKLYRLDLINKYNLRFKRGLSLGEDRDFNLRYFSHCQRIMISDYVGYYYRKDVEYSLTHQTHKDVLLHDYEAINQKKSIFIEKSALNEDACIYINQMIINLLFDELVRLSSLTKGDRRWGDFNFIITEIGDNWKVIKKYSDCLELSKFYKWLFFNKKFRILLMIMTFKRKYLK